MYTTQLQHALRLLYLFFWNKIIGIRSTLRYLLSPERFRIFEKRRGSCISVSHKLARIFISSSRLAAFAPCFILHRSRVILCLVVLMVLGGSAGAAYPKKKLKKSYPPSSTSKPNTPSTLKDMPTQEPPLKKPKLLSPIQLLQEDPLVGLDKLVVKRQETLAPYIPLVQTIDIALDYGKLFMKLWNTKEHKYVGGISILFRKNFQLSGTLGYSKLYPALVHGNQNTYTAAGTYGSLGLEYLVNYNQYNNLYAGVRYGRSYFRNSTLPRYAHENPVSKTLQASWWELMLGSEQQIFSNWGLYTGFVSSLKGLGNFGKFEPATNYVVPGYGRNVLVAVPSVNLYIKYKVSFLEKQIQF